MFTSIFVGMAFSRGSHQQFYYWYSFTLPFLADAMEFDCISGITKAVILMIIEVGWTCRKNKSGKMSMAMTICHAVILIGLIKRKGVNIMCSTFFKRTQKKVVI